jgi:hypothetical protein
MKIFGSLKSFLFSKVCRRFLLPWFLNNYGLRGWGTLRHQKILLTFVISRKFKASYSRAFIVSLLRHAKMVLPTRALNFPNFFKQINLKTLQNYLKNSSKFSQRRPGDEFN